MEEKYRIKFWFSKLFLQLNPSMKNKVDPVPFSSFMARQNTMRLLTGKAIYLGYETSINNIARCFKQYDLRTSKVLDSISFFGLAINKRMKKDNKIKLTKLLVSMLKSDLGYF